MISIINLLNGQEIIATVSEVSGNPNELYVDDPCIFWFEVIDQLSQKIKLNLQPFMPHARQKKIKIQKSAIVAIAQPMQDLEKLYKQAKSPIEQVEKPSLILPS